MKAIIIFVGGLLVGALLTLFAAKSASNTYERNQTTISNAVAFEELLGAVRKENWLVVAISARKLNEESANSGGWDLLFPITGLFADKFTAGMGSGSAKPDATMRKLSLAAWVLSLEQQNKSAESVLSYAEKQYGIDRTAIENAKTELKKSFVGKAQ
ncbi:MAG: hypothetical protein ABL985_13030 [Casimicrobium sp.]